MTERPEEHNWRDAWYCTSGEHWEPKSGTDYERDDSGWTFHTHIAPEHGEDVVRHEMAHILTRFRFGGEPEAHGPEFEAILQELDQTFAESEVER